MIDLSFPNTTEGAIQAKCYQWFVNNFPDLRQLLQSIPNESKRSKVYASTLKAMGLTPGWPDMAFHFRGKTTFLECKIPGGNPSDEQLSVRKALTKQGFDVLTFRDLSSFQKALEASFGGMIWRDLMRADLTGRNLNNPGEIPKGFEIGGLTDSTDLGSDPWSGVTSASDIAKLQKAELTLLASRLALDSYGNKGDLIDRIVAAWNAYVIEGETNPSE